MMMVMIITTLFFDTFPTFRTLSTHRFELFSVRGSIILSAWWVIILRLHELAITSMGVSAAFLFCVDIFVFIKAPLSVRNRDQVQRL